MPKPMLRQPQTQTENILSATAAPKQDTTQMDKLKLDRLLRKPRSRAYMDAIRRLDAGGHVHNKNKVDDIIGAIKAEFPELELTGVLLGYVAVCYLGKPYEVHTLDITGEIIQHFKHGEILPGGLEKARSIAMHGNYDFIEVYSDCCRCVTSNGMVSVVYG